MDDLILIKKQLTGANFKRLLKNKKITKYRLSKDTGISYQTFCYWQSGKSYPKDAYAERVGKYLGLISDKDQIIKLRKEASELQRRIENLEQGK